MADPILGTYPQRDWPTALPSDCPVGPSDVLAGLRLNGRYARYTDADTWFPSWAADGHMYSPFTDGHVGPWASNSKGVCAMTGYARIEGSDPQALRVIPLGTEMGSPVPYVGRYPSGCLHFGGVWYHGTYLVHEERGPDGRMRDLLGPFVSFRKSADGGATWSPDRYGPTHTMFGESLEGDPRPTIKLGSPRFVDLGRELEHSPDGKAYFVGFGNLPGQGHLNWILGDAIFIGRADPRLSDITEASAWEWFAGSAEAPRWSADIADATSIFTWPRSVGQLSMSYVPAVDRYVMCVSYARRDAAPTVSYILDAPQPWGPWTMVAHWDGFGQQAYFLNFPSRFLTDDRRGWLCYSANHSLQYLGAEGVREDPIGSRYAMCLHEVEFLTR